LIPPPYKIIKFKVKPFTDIGSFDDEGIGTMMEDGITPTEEEYDGMIVEMKVPKPMTRKHWINI
jgi:hypothetical protein